MTFCLINKQFIGSDDIDNIEIARAYIRMRMKDAVACCHQLRFNNPIELAKYLARYW